MTSKKFVVDTNVLVHDYNSFTNILNDDNIVYIPLVVLEELDNLKTKLDQVGVNARKAIRSIEKELVNGNARVIIEETTIDPSKADNKILAVCSKLKKEGINPILVSKDVCLRTKARSNNIETEDYKNDKVDSSKLYSGISDTPKLVTKEIIDFIFKNGQYTGDGEYNENECVIFQDIENPKNRAITIFSNGKFNIINNKVEVFGLKPNNLEQTVVLNHLLNPDIKLVTILGRAGSGKTLLSIASALEMVLEKNYYNKITIARPIMPFQKDIGFLPGDVNEKLGPWMMPIVDNLDFLFNFAEQPRGKSGAKVSAYEELKERGILDVCPLTYIRGRSIPKHFMIIDECLEENQVVYTNFGKMKIKDVAEKMKDNDVEILSKNIETGKVEFKELQSIKIEEFKTSKEKMYEIELEDGSIIKVTGSHKLMINGKYQKIDDIINSNEELFLDNLKQNLNQFAKGKI